MDSIQFGNDAGCVKITLPASYSVDGWAQADVEITVPGFQGRLSAWVDAADFDTFSSQLRALYESLEGKAEFRPSDEQFVLLLTAGKLGHVEVSGEAWSFATFGSKLEFEFELDQSYLMQPLSDLERLQATVKSLP